MGNIQGVIVITEADVTLMPQIRRMERPAGARKYPTASPMEKGQGPMAA